MRKVKISKTLGLWKRARRLRLQLERCTVRHNGLSARRKDYGTK